jgi:hypothetical protein
MNVSAGIGILGQASKMCSDMFGVSAAVGGGFAGLLEHLQYGRADSSGRRSPDHIGRQVGLPRSTFCSGRLSIAWFHGRNSTQNRMLFVLVTAVIITMYGGGFATIPAYLRGSFGTYQVGAIHGRLITARGRWRL